MTRIRRRHINPASTDHAIDAYFNDLVAGVLAPRDAIDPELAALAAELVDEGRQSVVPLKLQSRLWEDMMNIAGTLGESKAFPPDRPPLAAERHDRSTILTGSQTTMRQEGNRSWYRQFAGWVAAGMLLLGIAGGAVVLQQSGTDAPAPTTALMAPLAATPEATPGEGVADAARCTAPEVQLDELASILDHAVKGERYPGWPARSTRSEVLDVRTTPLPLEVTSEADAAIADAIIGPFTMYWDCVRAGAPRQKLSLFTGSGIARTFLDADGTPLWTNLFYIGLPPSPETYDYASVIPEIVSTEILADGRVALGYTFGGGTEVQNYLIFQEVDGQWLIDEVL